MQQYIDLIDKKLEEFMPINYPQKIFKAMKYTVTLKGKRLRPIMCLETCKMFGGNFEDAIPTACAIEMLHAQTLIHDDLPCMDNDMYRRGKLTNHMVFGEANAVLAGDALLTFAPQTILKNSKNLGTEKLLKIMEEYFNAAGAFGVIAGQVVDIESEKLLEHSTYADYVIASNSVPQGHPASYHSQARERCKQAIQLFNPSPELLNSLSSSSNSSLSHKGRGNCSDEQLPEILDYIHTHKTADLFKLALRTGAIIADATEQQINDITEFGQYMGVAFQIADDILDVTSTFEEMGKTLGKDKEAGKLTYVNLYGLEKSKKDLNELIDKCFDILKKHNLQSKVFEQILNKIRNN